MNDWKSEKYFLKHKAMVKPALFTNIEGEKVNLKIWGRDKTEKHMVSIDPRKPKVEAISRGVDEDDLDLLMTKVEKTNKQGDKIIAYPYGDYSRLIGVKKKSLKETS